MSTVRTLKSTPMVFCCLSEKIPDLKFCTTQVLPTLESPIRMILNKKSKESSCSGPGFCMAAANVKVWEWKKRELLLYFRRSLGMLGLRDAGYLELGLSHRKGSWSHDVTVCKYVKEELKTKEPKNDSSLACNQPPLPAAGLIWMKW